MRNPGQTQVLVSVHLIVTETQVFSGWSLGGQAQHKYNKACVCVVCCVLALLGVARLGREPVAKLRSGRRRRRLKPNRAS